MPENRELSSSGKLAVHGLSVAQQAGENMALEVIVCDATSVEAKTSGASDRAKLELPYELDSTSVIQRGSKDHQSPVFPPWMKSSATTPNPPSLDILVLESIKSTHRALILGFGFLSLMV